MRACYIFVEGITYSFLEEDYIIQIWLTFNETSEAMIIADRMNMQRIMFQPRKNHHVVAIF